MTKRKKTVHRQDINQLAASTVDAVTCEPASTDLAHLEKNPAAVALGRLGGQKGGKARAEKLSAAKRKAIASNAAKARWSKD